MRMLRPVIVAAAMGAALLCGTVPAHASDNLPSVSLSPDFAEPQETVSITVTCAQASVRRSVVTSDAFDPVTIATSEAHESILSSTTVIKNVRPGKYRVTSTCDDTSSSSTTLTILAPGAPHVVPEGGAHTGGGSMAPNRRPSAAVGGALLASGLGLVAITLRRRVARR
jgi:hypothetical protein